MCFDIFLYVVLSSCLFSGRINNKSIWSSKYILYKPVTKVLAMTACSSSPKHSQITIQYCIDDVKNVSTYYWHNADCHCYPIALELKFFQLMLTTNWLISYCHGPHLNFDKIFVYWILFSLCPYSISEMFPYCTSINLVLFKSITHRLYRSKKIL